MVERFDAVEDHADYGAAMAYEPRVGTALYEAITIVMLVAAVVFVVIGIVILVVFPPMGLVWIASCVGFAFLAYLGFQDARAFARAPIMKSVRLVLRTRTEVTGSTSHNGSSASTSYFVTLADRDGNRTELRADGFTVGHLVPNDIGVAYTKRNRLVEFRRFDV